MAERRQAVRRESIEVEVEGVVFLAEPLPWLQANDLGNEIIRQNVEAMNNFVRMYMDDNIPQMEMELKRKISDWNAVLVLAYPKNKPEDWKSFDNRQNATLALTAMEVNDLEHINHLVDPNLPALTMNGGSDPLEMLATGLGAKTESTPHSVSEGSPESPSST